MKEIGRQNHERVMNLYKTNDKEVSLDFILREILELNNH